MQEIIKRSVRTFILFIFAGAITFSFSVDAFAKQVPAEPTSYRTVTEIHDWGAAITKVILI
ncbi:hypothetical protein ABES80_07875 [Bacillus gobiensis]|uniref:hypothetical protein n=1 Tax=Bacillus gobiensis TaxID=1441095 RepID=UPI003D1C1768